MSGIREYLTPVSELAQKLAPEPLLKLLDTLLELDDSRFQREDTTHRSNAEAHADDRQADDLRDRVLLPVELLVDVYQRLLKLFGDDGFRVDFQRSQAAELAGVIGDVWAVIFLLAGHGSSPCSVCGASSVGERSRGGGESVIPGSGGAE